MLQNAGATGLPNWWGFSEDHTLLIEADEYGYYPNSRSRGAVSEGFISVFLQHRCKQHCKVASQPCWTTKDKQHLPLDMKTALLDALVHHHLHMIPLHAILQCGTASDPFWSVSWCSVTCAL